MATSQMSDKASNASKGWRRWGFDGHLGNLVLGGAPVDRSSVGPSPGRSVLRSRENIDEKNWGGGGDPSESLRSAVV